MGNDTEHEQGARLQNVLVEHVADGVRIASIGLTSVEEKDILQEAELRDGVV